MHNRWFACLVTAALLLPLLAACGGSAASTAPTTLPTASVGAPIREATTAPTAFPTVVPTTAPLATPIVAPTEKATAAPGVASPIALDTFVGVWTRFSTADGAPIFLVFSTNGTFRGAVGPDYASSATSFKGAYELTNGTLLVTNSSGDCGDNVGTYRPELQSDGQFLFFNPLDEPCSDRGFDGRWKRYVP
jgi:hypothetical protein